METERSCLVVGLASEARSMVLSKFHGDALFTDASFVLFSVKQNKTASVPFFWVFVGFAFLFLFLLQKILCSAMILLRA